MSGYIELITELVVSLKDESWSPEMLSHLPDLCALLKKLLFLEAARLIGLVYVTRAYHLYQSAYACIDTEIVPWSAGTPAEPLGEKIDWK